MSKWGIVATVKAPQPQLLAFVAHHLELGAAQIWLCFDDPADQAAEALERLPRVSVLRCTLPYWRETCGRRPEKHQNRQSRNAQHIYAATDLTWLAHLDVDEFLLPDRPIAALLAAAPPEQPMLRAAPWEALHEPGAPDDIFTARQFRAALPVASDQAARDVAFGRFAPLLPEGVLSHAAGKCLFRTGLAGFEPRLHGAFRFGSRVVGVPFQPGLALLHFHAQDPLAWRERLDFRLARGAYQYNPALQAHLLAADDAGRAAFYSRVQSPEPAIRAQLAGLGLLRSETLKLREAIARMETTCI